MKSLFLMILAILAPIVLSAQVIEKVLPMSAGDKSALEVDLKVDSKTAEKIWKDYVKPYGKVDWDRRNKEHVLFNKRISSISTDEISIINKFNNYGNQTKGAFWIKKGDDYITSADNPEILRQAAEFLREYAFETERHAIRQEINDQEGDLKSLDKDLEKLQKEKENLLKDIEEAKQEIAKKEKEIVENTEKQEDKQKEIESQKEKIKETTLKLTSVGKNNN